MNRSLRHLSQVLVLVLAAGCVRSPSASESAGSDPSSGEPSMVTPRISSSNYDITPLSREKVAELAAKLDPETYRVTQSQGTERPFCGTLLDNKKDGFYACVVCGLPLFSSEAKFNSGTGWPSFYMEFDPDHVRRHEDQSLGMTRVEIECARCGAHLGHVFDDGPKPTGERHCLNSASLTFVEKGQPLPAESKPIEVETAYFAGGCFWGIEHYFQEGPGVIDAVSGYMQGKTENPTYKQVCSGNTGHAETVKVVYDPKKITYRRLLEAFFAMHDPTQIDRQGPDVGSQYRSGIWTTSDAQAKEAKSFLDELAAKKAFGGKKFATQVEPAKTFYAAEEYHQDYVENTGRACHVSNPW